MKKQVDFSLRVFELNPNEAGKSSAQVSTYIRDNYLVDGWEVQNTEVAQVTAGSIFVAVTFVKYGYETLPSESESVGVPVKRGPGRPKIVEEVVPA